MAESTTSSTAGELMDRSAVLMNDPSKTDYNYAVLLPFLKLAMDELSDSLMDSQSSPSLRTTFKSTIFLPVGKVAIYPYKYAVMPIPEDEAIYPADLVEIQEVGERRLGSTSPFIPMRRVEFMEEFPVADNFGIWSFQDQIIWFNRNGASSAREIQLKYVRDYIGIFDTDNISEIVVVAPINSRTFLTYKTAALAAQFVGENTERAAILEAKATEALDKMESTRTKGRQQIMTRHRPFRAAWKMRGGF